LEFFNETDPEFKQRACRKKQQLDIEEGVNGAIFELKGNC